MPDDIHTRQPPLPGKHARSTREYVPTEEDRRRVDSAISGAQRALMSLWNETGSWRSRCDAGPVTSAVVAVVLRFVRQLDGDTSAGLQRYLAGSQLASSGGFPPYPGAPEGDLSTTAICYAGLVATGLPENSPELQRARKFIETHGKWARVLELAKTGDLAGLLLAMTGVLRAEEVPGPSILLGLLPGSELLLERRFAFIVPFRALVTDVLLTYLRGEEPRREPLPRLPRVDRLPSNVRDASDLMSRWLDDTSQAVSDKASAAARSGAGLVTELVTGAARTGVRFTQGAITSLAGAADGLRLGPLHVVDGIARGILESGQAVASGAIGALDVVRRAVPAAREAGLDLVRDVEGLRAERYLHHFRNADGSWLYGDSMHTVLALAALHALGYSMTDAEPQESLRWLMESQKVVDEKTGGIRFNIFWTDVWPTAFALRALFESEVSMTEPAIARALRWLIAVQREGSWAFQGTNTTTPDVDDTAVAMATLAQAQTRLIEEGPARSEHLLTACTGAIDAARSWLLQQQNADGGWASYQKGLPSKPPGAIMTGPPRLPGHRLADQARYALDPPPELGDPATEDLTARVLFALGKTGLTDEDPAVARGIEFLRHQQDRNGGWWGRWVVNYLGATAWALKGLVSVQANLQQDWVKRGIKFLLKRQRDDGGWSEVIASYRQPALAGVNPNRGETSNPCLTGLVLSALIDLGYAEDPSVERGIAFLVQYYEDHGWKATETDLLHALFPPDLFYTLPQTELQLPLEALGQYRAHFRSWKATPPVEAPPSLASRRAEIAAVGGDDGPPAQSLREMWTPPDFDQLAEHGDSEADEVIARVFAKDQTRLLHAVFDLLVRNEDVPPRDRLPRAVAAVDPSVWDFFESTRGLPAVDPKEIRLAQSLFKRAGFGVPLALFCSSLPQCYAFPDGARLLFSAGDFVTNARRRLVETAQLVFDVATPGGLEPQGRGIRTAQKVRLLHAAVRKLARDARVPRMTGGQPLNQTELVGTLMTFSVVVVDGLRGLGFAVSDEEAEAWYQMWRAVGVVLGIEDGPERPWLPPRYADGVEVMDQLRRDFWGRSEEGQALAQVTLRVMHELLPGDTIDGVAATLVRHLAGDHCADLLGVPDADWTRVMVGRSPLLNTLLGRASGVYFESPLTPLLQTAAFDAMEALSNRQRDGKEVKFRVHTELLAGWQNQFQRRVRPF
jgi:squalene cyclase